jgi:hypothetical protein
MRLSLSGDKLFREGVTVNPIFHFLKNSGTSSAKPQAAGYEGSTAVNCTSTRNQFLVIAAHLRPPREFQATVIPPYGYAL